MNMHTVLRTALRPAIAATVGILAFLSLWRGPSGLPAAGQSAEVEGSSRSGAMEALEFWSRARAYPGADLPSRPFFRAFEATAAMRKKPEPLSRGLSGTDAATASGWKYIGPANLSGRTLALAINPQNRSTLYAGSASGGLWRSNSGGVDGDWERVVTGYPVLGVAAIAIDPVDTSVMYIGTGEVYRYGGTAGGVVTRTTRGSYGMGILRTTDAGATWSKSLDWSYNAERGVQAIRLNPLNPSTVWAATSEGLYRSTDRGGSWTNEVAVTMGEDIVIHPADTLRMLVSFGNLGLSSAILKTTDGGANWLPVTPTNFNGKTLLSQFAANPEVVYASIADSTTGVGGLWRSDNFGTSWTKLSDNTTNNIFGVQGWYSHFVAVHPLDSTQVVHAGVPARRSTDGGSTFGGVSGSYSDHHAFAIDPVDPDILYVANDDGVYRSTNFGADFTKVSDNLGTGQFYTGFSVSSTDSALALGQAQDHIPGYLYTGSPTWPPSAADEIGWTAIDQTNDNIMYAGTRGGGSVRKSTNRGVSFPTSSGGFSGLTCWNAPFILSPSDPSILYFGRSRIFKSLNGAAGWAATNGGVELDGNGALSMAMSSLGPDTVYVGTAPMVTRSHIFMTTDGGAGWSDVTGPLPDRYPLDIAVDPHDATVAYVGFGGYGTGHVFKTTNAGGSWSDITGTLPDIPVTALLVDPLDPAIVYLGSDLGVFISTDGGASWGPFGDGLPEAVLVSDLAMTPSNRTLRAATHGNGVFERRVPSTVPAVAVVSPAGGEVWETGSMEVIAWEETLVDSVDIEYSTDDGATWMAVATGLPALPDTFSWTVPATVTTAGRVRVRSSADTAVAGASGSSFTITFTGVIIGLDEGWNLVSIPPEVPDLSRYALFPDAAGPAFGYDGGYVVRDTLGYGEGFWVKYPQAGFIPIAGDSVRSDTVALRKGWNLIGGVGVAVPAAALTTIPPSLLSTPLYGYDGGYSAGDTIEPGRGYWVKSLAAGLLVIDADAPSLLPDAGRMGGAHVDVGGGTISFRDAAGRRASLPLITGRPDAPGQEPPPLPPPGGFDVRFAEGLPPALDDGRYHQVLLRGAAFPGVLSWELPAGSAYELAAGENSIQLEGSGEVTIGPATGISLRRSPTGGMTLPSTMTLLQNYPNPFNPGTRISFSLPGGPGTKGSGTFTTLRVYDVGGRLVETLLEREVGPGDVDLWWDAGDLPGGVYFAVLRAGAISRSMKMLLLR